jgi:rRNA processing protein Gar1
VGTVVAVTPSGFVTVRASGPEPVPEGTNVADPTGTLRGRVSRVFGPVARPYLSVRPRRAPAPAEAVGLLGQSLLRE